MPLQRLRLRNFQAHENLVIDLDPEVTTIVGRSDAGKSAVLRALRWLCLNRPQGDAFLRHGSDQVSVRLKADDVEVLRERGPSLNSYSLDGHLFQAFGSDVPQAITDLLAVGPDNFQGQHDGPYWFLQSPGEVSRELNAVVALDLIDRTLANLASEHRRCVAVRDVATARLQEATEAVGRLSWTAEAEAELKALEDQEKALTDRREQYERFGRLAEEVSRTTTAAKRSGCLAARLAEGMERLDNLRQKWESLCEERGQLIELAHELKERQESACRSHKQANHLEKEWQKAMAGKCPLCGRSPIR